MTLVEILEAADKSLQSRIEELSNQLAGRWSSLTELQRNNLRLRKEILSDVVMVLYDIKSEAKKKGMK